MWHTCLMQTTCCWGSILPWLAVDLAADVVFIAEPWTVPWTAKTILQVIEQVEVEYVPEKAEFDGHLDEEFKKDSLDSLVFTYTQRKMGRSAYYNPCIWFFFFFFNVL
ncbi:hypothetical protein ACSBR2_009439 [Camellia fascicularis]